MIFVRKEFSWVVGGYSASINVANNPKRETLIVNTTMKIAFMHEAPNIALEEVFELIYDAFAHHVPEKSSL